jgi:hypothetical protein
MHTSRRHALRLGLYATASLVTAAGLAEAAPQAAPAPQPPPAGDDSAWLRRDLFESCVGERFVLRTPTGRMALRLMRVVDPPRARRRGDEHNFVVVLRGPLDPKLRQGTYPIDSRSLGSFELFLVPGRATTAGTLYTATFNRLA